MPKPGDVRLRYVMREAGRGNHDDLLMADLLGVFACAQALREKNTAKVEAKG